MDFNIL